MFSSVSWDWCFDLEKCTMCLICFVGVQKFCFNGRLMFGPDGKSLILTMSLIVVPVILFCSFVSSGLVHMYPHHIGNCIVAVAVVCAIYVSSKFFTLHD